MTTVSTDHLTGLIAAPHTPFDAQGAVRFDVIEAQADWLESQGVSGVFVCGTTGEGASLTNEERKQVAHRWIKAAGRRLHVIVHVGHASLAEACDLAQHAAALQPFAISAVPPSFFKPASIDSLVETCRHIAAAAGNVPFYYYHIPSMTGVDLSMTAFLLSAAERIPTLRGIKYTHGDLLEYRQCLTLMDGRFDVPFGRDEMLLCGLALGARSAVGSTYNYAAPHYLNLIKAFEAGEWSTARGAMDAVGPLISLLRECGEIASAKAIMSLLGIPCGNPRLPLRPLSASQVRRVEQFVETWSGFKRRDHSSMTSSAHSTSTILTASAGKH